MGEPDGTDVAGLLRPRAEIGGMFQAACQSMLPATLRFGLTTEAAAQAFVADITQASRERRGAGMSPLLVSAWKHKPPGTDTSPARWHSFAGASAGSGDSARLRQALCRSCTVWRPSQAPVTVES